MKKLHFTGKILTSVFFLVLILSSCRKEDKLRGEELQSKSKHVSPYIAVPNCPSLSPLAWASSYRLRGVYGPITLDVDYPYWRITCDDGSIIPLQNYLPFYGQISIEGSNGVVNMQPGVSNQFVISVGTWSLPDGQAVLDGIHKFESAWNAWVSSGSGAAPDVSTYVPKSTTSTLTLTGKLIRTTTGTTFAAIGTCYPNVFPCNNLVVE